ncbi:NAD-dependent epimerase/dehydratase family protein [Georgenia sp. Z1344]|uniref:NAD-dependent epimerase/dehydratase family protein n=1 Tax=Georgenia sp. Z1344 TaxID=3416706 RepID=UPI003CEA78EC
MRVAVVGASGNAGTAVLRALAGSAEVDEIVAIARRLPEPDAEPYASATWHRIDLALPARTREHEDRLIDEIATAIRGADAVVHLAWLIQPNRQRDLLRRANVTGTARVAEAAARAGVPHLVVASSVGAYSPVDDDTPRDESWPTEGIPTSHYSVDKAAQERVLDHYEEQHPDLRVARLRPALVFGSEPAAEIRRYFLGPLVPAGLLRPGRLPVMPVPTGLRLQVVHADDLADAYLRVVLERAAGPFNIAADPVLTAQDLADVLDHGRLVRVPPRLLRPAVSLAWEARAVAADAGWLDMGMAVPVMDATRARTELGWHPRHDAGSALRALLTGIADGTGMPSTPMRPAEAWPTDATPAGGALRFRAQESGGTPAAHRVPATLDRHLLGLYLSDHLTGATGGSARARRMADAHGRTELGPELADLAEQIESERLFLRDLVETLDLRPRAHRQVAAWAAERIGRLKLNGRLVDSPMTPVLETELLRSAVIGKLGVWEVLARLADELGLPRAVFDQLADDARQQAEVIGRLHDRVTGHAFATARQKDGQERKVAAPGE